MKTSSIISAIIAGTFILFILGYLFYILILGNVDLTIRSVAKIERGPIFFPAIILMEVGYACLMVLIFSKWSVLNTFSSGLKAGALMGLLIGLCSGLEHYATTYFINTTGVMLKAISFAIRFGMAGGVIAWVIGRQKRG